MPWKNGRGETAEIAIWPRGADFASGAFEWRVSRAAIVEDGPFSNFSGHDRTLVLLTGEGIEIEHGAAAGPRRLRSFEPHVFRGDWPTTARLVAGAVTDFNVLHARARITAHVDVVTAPVAIPLNTDHLLIHCVSGTVAVEFEARHDLAAFETLWIEGADGRAAVRIVPATASSRALIVQLTRSRSG
jgi:uncharacterized protein